MNQSLLKTTKIQNLQSFIKQQALNAGTSGLVPVQRAVLDGRSSN